MTKTPSSRQYINRGKKIFSLPVKTSGIKTFDFNTLKAVQQGYNDAIMVPMPSLQCVWSILDEQAKWTASFVHAMMII